MKHIKAFFQRRVKAWVAFFNDPEHPRPWWNLWMSTNPDDHSM